MLTAAEAKAQGAAQWVVDMLERKEANELAKKAQKRSMRDEKVKDVESLLQEQLDGEGLKVFINQTQVNVEDEETGDKYYLTSSSTHSRIKFDFKVNIEKTEQNINDLGKLLNMHSGSYKFKHLDNHGRTYIVMTAMVEVDEVHHLIKRLQMRVKPVLQQIRSAA